MKKRSTILLTALAGLMLGIIGLAAREATPDAAAPFGNTSAAFRDGLYQARLQAEQGKKPHVASGRWMAREDRIAFVAGFAEGCRKVSAVHPEMERRPSAIELAGFRDGIEDGLRDQMALQPFRVHKTIAQRKAAALQTDLISDNRNDDPLYRDAYVNGYQHGYYASLEMGGLRDRI